MPIASPSKGGPEIRHPLDIVTMNDLCRPMCIKFEVPIASANLEIGSGSENLKGSSDPNHVPSKKEPAHCNTGRYGYVHAIPGGDRFSCCCPKSADRRMDGQTLLKL